MWLLGGLPPVTGYYRRLPLTTARNRGLVSAEERHEADDVLLQLLLHALRLGCGVLGLRAAELAAEERDLALDQAANLAGNGAAVGHVAVEVFLHLT